MIFLRYESFGQYVRMYRVTSLILLINILFFIDTLIQGHQSLLWQYGALFHFPPFNTEVWRYFLSMFLHANFEHALFNLFAIFVFAPPLERFLGAGRYALLYLVSGLIGNIASLVFNSPLTISVGASGAIYGIYGAYLYMILFRSQMLDIASRKTITILMILGVIHTLFMPQINIYAHFGGLLGGLVIFSNLIRRRI